MERYMDALRACKPPPKRAKITQEDQEDCIEGGLHVPNSVLDGCESGFTAADEHRAKASTQFFDDTALMALLCHHDIVLFLANMHSAGEKQHYVMALVETLFQHLPLECCLGILYDIRCQAERSCVKWGFLDCYMDRLSFGISVFHVFGHQWACQIIYHPRKCRGFGLSHGEGCECFWHSISKLIAYLQVCGYHQQLYTLDCQVDYAHDEIIEGLGAWLLRRSQHVLKKCKAMELILQGCGDQEVLLRAQWDAQVAAQTKPLPCQSKKAGKDTVNELIRLRETQNDLKKHVKEYDAIIADVDLLPDEYADARTELESVHKRLEELRTRIRRKQAVLGVGDRTQLTNLINNPFLALRMQMLALKQRLRDRLRFRKFELDRLERLFRKQVHGFNKITDQKINDHTASSVNRRDPSISKLALNYNHLRDEMAALIQAHKALPCTLCPEKIETKGLFALDVDDTIWQDVGLDEGSNGVPPPWLASESVRAGI
ncbi:hypothetical protein DXG01_008639 [Tephrocybe rancida]|nr:hypothetical protein DXG01_008639 [Tephrocybe rancida]